MWALCLAAALLGQAAPPPLAPEQEVAAVLEELRKGELFLDAEALQPFVAHSFTWLEGEERVAGAFAFLESVRRARAAGQEVKRLIFSEVQIRVYGASAIVSYRYVKDWRSGRRERGVATDVLEKRDDGVWILVHRHRAPVPLGGRP